MIDTKKLTKEFNNLEEEVIVLIETSAENILEVHLAAGLILLKLSSRGNYIILKLKTLICF
jgi:hypothetical protein